jgi:hypothetical protein
MVCREHRPGAKLERTVGVDAHFASMATPVPEGPAPQEEDLPIAWNVSAPAQHDATSPLGETTLAGAKAVLTDGQVDRAAQREGRVDEALID